VTPPILSVLLHSEHDVVTARQRARDIAAELGFDRHDQTRIATAVSEIARNAVNYAREGRVEFYLGHPDGAETLAVHIGDRGPGISALDLVMNGRYVSKTGMGQGILGARRLMDGFDIDSSTQGTSVWLRKHLPRGAAAAPQPEKIARHLEQRKPRDVFDELRQENQELLHAMEELRRRQEETSRLNSELEETNRGVVALYAELDERAEQLRRADQAKTRFLSHVSHEFRTPLNSILALSRLLLNNTDGPLTPEQQKQMWFIRQSADTLLEIVNDLLDLARVESGKTEVRRGEVRIDSLFGTLRGMMRPLLTNDAVALIFEDPAGLPPLYTDEAKLAQILRNFISNALKFTEKGEVRARAERAPDASAVILSVSDTGIGIAPEDQQRIFDEFVQVPNPLQTKVKGTGLGLPLARKLTELLGGRIAVESRPGAGSVFSLTIPVVWRAEGVQAPPPAPARILIIDDEEIARYLLRQSLAAQPELVDEASGGEEGLAKACQTPPQAIFLDLLMPGMDGREALRLLKADPATRDIPVFIITSKKLTAAERAELEPQAAAILSKELLTRQGATAEIQNALAKAGVHSAGTPRPGFVVASD
jgi:signal transduction histidine kinase/ActR/RegA family two-component response regulator